MNGIGIHSMRRIARTKGNWRYWSSREKKEEKKKKRRNERGHNDIPYCDFITAQLILFGSESLRIAFRFRGVKTPAANTPNTLDPFPFPFLSAALPVTLSYLSSPGSIPFRPQLFPSPSPSRKNRKNLKAPLNRVHVFLLLTDFPPPLSSPRLFAPRLFATRVSRFTERVSRDVTPAFPSPLFLLSFPPSFFGFRGTRGPGNRANQLRSFRNERRRRRLSRLRLFLSVWTVVVVSPLLWARKR